MLHKAIQRTSYPVLPFQTGETGTGPQKSAVRPPDLRPGGEGPCRRHTPFINTKENVTELIVARAFIVLE